MFLTSRLLLYFRKVFHGFQRKGAFLVQIFLQNSIFPIFCACFACIKWNNICALHYASHATSFKRNTEKIKFSLFSSIKKFVITAQPIRSKFFYVFKSITAGAYEGGRNPGHPLCVPPLAPTRVPTEVGWLF